MRNVKKKWLFKTLLLLTLALLAFPVGASANVGINKKKVVLVAGSSTKLKLTGLTGTESSIVWSVENANIASIKQSGLNAKLTAKAKGSTYVCATVDGTEYRCKLKVKQPNAAIRLNKAKKKLKKGKTYQLKATIEPAGAGNVSVQWRSSNKKVAKVSSKGKVTAVGAGTATITAYAKNGKATKATCKITVKTDPIKLNASQLNLTVGQNTKLQVTSSTSGATYTWSSSDKTVATVTKKGKVKGKKAGTAVITAKRSSDGATASCTVTVMLAQTSTLQPSAAATKLLSFLQKYSNQVQADKAAGIKWTYSNDAKNNWADAYKASRKKKVGYVNCALTSRWALRDLGYLDSANFWGIKGGGIEFRGTAKTQILQHCVILSVNKTPNQLLAEGNLLPGDICSYVSMQHTNVYAGNGLWYDSGRCGANGSYVNGQYIFDSFGPEDTISMSGTKIGHIIRIIK